MTSAVLPGQAQDLPLQGDGPKGLSHEAVLALLINRQGRALGVTAREAVQSLVEVYDSGKARQFRQLVMDLRDRGWPICSTAADGYFWPSSVEELKAALNWQRSREIATLRQIGRQQRWGAQVLAGQQSLGDMEALTMPAELGSQGAGEDKHPNPQKQHNKEEGEDKDEVM
ncbi:MAG: hypothetical protein ACFB0C_24565 [Leptolyngbyaceae cyanobacterium]